MFGPPEPADGCCNATLLIGDDYGDNHATMQCRLPLGHEGDHVEEYKRMGKPVKITWGSDDRPVKKRSPDVILREHDDMDEGPQEERSEESEDEKDTVGKIPKLTAETPPWIRPLPGPKAPDVILREHDVDESPQVQSMPCSMAPPPRK